MSMVTKLRSMGIENVMRLTDTSFLHPNIDQEDGYVYIGIYNGNQKVFLVKEQSMDNSDGSEWTYWGQKKTLLLYLSHDEEDGSFTWYYEDTISS